MKNKTRHARRINKEYKEMLGLDSTAKGNDLSPEEEIEAFNEGNAEAMANALDQVRQMAEVGLMIQKNKIKDKKDRDMYVKRQATAIYLFKMLIDSLKEEMAKPEFQEQHGK